MAAILVGDIQPDLDNYSPIFGLAAMVGGGSFEEAVDETGVPGLDGAVFLAKAFAEQFKAANPHDPLDENEIAGFNLYTMESPFYLAFNRALASKDRQQAKPFMKFLRLVLGGAHKLPLIRGMFARGIKNPNLAHYFDGRSPFFWWAFTSTTKKVGVTKQFLGDGPRMLFMIDGAGIDIAPYSACAEAEVLMLPGSRLQVVDVLNEAGDLTITTLKQLPSPPVVDFPHPGMADALAGGAALPAAGGGGGGGGAGGGIFQFDDLKQVLGLLDGDLPDIQPALDDHGLVSVDDMVAFLTDECGGVTADGLKQMGIKRFGTRKRMLEGLLKKTVVPAPAPAPAPVPAPAPAPVPAPVPAPGECAMFFCFSMYVRQGVSQQVCCR